jgi:streptogramin lyase
MAARHEAQIASARFSATLTRLKNGRVGRVALGAVVLVCVGLASSLLGAPIDTSAATSGVGPLAPGSVVVSQGGTIFGTGGSGIGTTVAANGEVNVYPPKANGDMAPEARFTHHMYGPTTLAFDPAGDLWVANENTATLVELTRAQLATPNPVPSVTILSASGALANPFGMAFDRGGNLWVVGNHVGQVFEYTKGQLAESGAPTPRTTIANFPGTPLSDAFDPSGDLWVSTNISSSCPQGCVVEFSRDELAMANPTPTVTISSTGGANLVFTPAGNLWMVTGGGASGCFGTPCTNELVEFTKAQLATSGAPAPTVTISSTTVGTAQSLDGPYGVAVNRSGDVWVSNFDGNTAVEFSQDQLATSGSPTPVRIIAGPHSGMNYPSFVVIEPSV